LQHIDAEIHDRENYRRGCQRGRNAPPARATRLSVTRSECTIEQIQWRHREIRAEKCERIVLAFLIRHDR